MRRSPARLLVLAAVLTLLASGAILAAPLPADGTVPSADGVPIRYHVEGQLPNPNPVLVFVHCWSCDRHLWDEQVAHFAKRHRVVTLDLAGHAHTFAYDARPALQEIKAPIHAINGDQHPTDVEGNRKLAPQYEMTLMKGTGHYLMLEDPQRFDGILEGVLGEMEGSGSAKQRLGPKPHSLSRLRQLQSHGTIAGELSWGGSTSSHPSSQVIRLTAYMLYDIMTV
jgi:hypothetical protein